MRPIHGVRTHRPLNKDAPVSSRPVQAIRRHNSHSLWGDFITDSFDLGFSVNAGPFVPFRDDQQNTRERHTIVQFFGAAQCYSVSPVFRVIDH